MAHRRKESNDVAGSKSSNSLSSSNAKATNKTMISSTVIPEASRKPVRTKPMRGVQEQPPKSPLRPHHHSSEEAHLMQPIAPVSMVSLTQEQTKMKEDFCTQLLMDGCVQSFIDFFYLTHRNNVPNENAPTATNALEQEEKQHAGIFQLKEMEFLRDCLMMAERCKRKGEIPDILNAYDSLATYCLEKGDHKTTIFFYEKCLEIAKLVKDQIYEMRVLSKIGDGYHTMRDLQKAQEYLEQYVSIAQVIYAHEDDEVLRSEAFVQLGKVYLDLATQQERSRQYENAIDYYKKYLDCSAKASDADAVGQGQFKLGVCYNALGQPANALPFLESYLTFCRKIGNGEGEGTACAELATAHEKLENKQLSIDFLNRYVAIATNAENVLSQADACRRLGHIYTASQDFQRAREMQEKHYELAPAVAAAKMDSTVLNSARIDVGAARANEKLALLLTLVKDDFHGLLEWKNSRIIPTVD